MQKKREIPVVRSKLLINYIHNELRNSLSVKRANKLQFINMNSDYALKQKTDEEIDNEFIGGSIGRVEHRG